MAARIMLGPGTKAQKQAKLTALATKVKHMVDGNVTCPDCGDEGPHNSQRYDDELEYGCVKCGSVFTFAG